MNEHEEKLERMLDAALAVYGAAEPLAGLEERVLGRLHAEPEHARPWWMWGAVAAAAALVLVALLVMSRSEPKSAPVVSKNPPVAAPAPTPARRPEPQVAKAPKTQPSSPRVTAAVAQDLPKRDVFPTPTPPGEQELLLAKYMRRTPREEILTMATRPESELPKDPWEAPANQPGGGGSTIQQFGR
jgi:hypothetical protein